MQAEVGAIKALVTEMMVLDLIERPDVHADWTLNVLAGRRSIDLEDKSSLSPSPTDDDPVGLEKRAYALMLRHIKDELSLARLIRS